MGYKTGRKITSTYPRKPQRIPNVGLMLGQRRRRWTNIEPTLDQCLRISGSTLSRSGSRASDGSVILAYDKMMFSGEYTTGSLTGYSRDSPFEFHVRGLVKLKKSKNPRITRKWVGGSSPNLNFFCVCVVFLYMFPKKIDKGEGWWVLWPIQFFLGFKANLKKTAIPDYRGIFSPFTQSAICRSGLTIKALNDFCKNHGNQRFF